MNLDLIFPTKSLRRAVWKPAVLCLLTCLLTAAVFATPAVKLSTVSGPPTTNVTISGSGFPASRLIDLYFDTTDMVLVVSSATGTFSNVRFQVPAKAQPGTHWVTAAVRASGLAAQKSFLVRTNWEQRGFTPNHKGLNPYENVLNPSNVGSLDLHWSFPTEGPVLSSPAVANGVVYVGSTDRNVYAINARTGAKLWSFPMPDQVFSSPAVVNGAVYVAARGSVWPINGELYALNARTGTLLWSFPIDSYYIDDSSPAVANGLVYVGSENNNVYAINARTGAKVWSFPTDGPLYSSPAVANGVTYVASSDKNVYALNANTGAKLWSFPTGGVVNTSPAVANGVVYVGTGYGDGKFYAVNASTGAKLWSFSTGVTNERMCSPTVANGVVYVATEFGKFYALDARTGAKLWSFPMPIGSDTSPVSSPAVANGVVYLASYFNIYALNARTGILLWSFPISTWFSSPVVANGVVYVGSYDYNLYAFDLAGGMLATAQSAERPDPANLIPDYTLRPLTP
jgi:outer membrane protein assembly factor BamB